MSSRAQAEPVLQHRDARGSVLEPLRPEELPVQRNVHVVLTEPGAIRGNHYHRRGTEVCVAYGPALMRIRDGATVEDVHIPAGEAYRFTIPPGVSHALKNTGSSPGLSVAFNTVEHDPAGSDVVRDVILD